MAAVVWHQFLDTFALTTSDPRMNDYFLMASPLQPILIVLFYLLFIHKLGPWFMKNREPFKLKEVIIAYNVLQIVCNTILFVLISLHASRLSMVCTPVDNSDTQVSKTVVKLHYCYTLLKFCDLIETIFFVLRKKDNQVSFLHVHHHIGMIGAAWVSGKYFPGGQAGYVALYNTFVHAVMYGYYLLTSWKSVDSIWWKKYVTLLQIIQHYLIFVSLIVPIVNRNCSYPKGILTFFQFNVVLMIYLFTKFYQKTYIKKKVKDNK